MHVLVTGGAGYIGSHTLLELLIQGMMSSSLIIYTMDIKRPWLASNSSLTRDLFSLKAIFEIEMSWKRHFRV